MTSYLAVSESSFWQPVAVAVIVTVAFAYLLLRGRLKGGKSCGGDCSCAAKSQGQNKDS